MRDNGRTFKIKPQKLGALLPDEQCFVRLSRGPNDERPLGTIAEQLLVPDEHFLAALPSLDDEPVVSDTELASGERSYGRRTPFVEPSGLEVP
jgi:hypothetical protein